MNNDAKAKLDNLMELLKSMNDIRTMSDEARKLYASMLVYNVDKIERVLKDSFVHAKNVLDNMDKEAKHNLFDKAALLGCLVRFKLDLEQSTTIAKEVKAKHDTYIKST